MSDGGEGKDCICAGPICPSVLMPCILRRCPDRRCPVTHPASAGLCACGRPCWVPAACLPVHPLACLPACLPVCRRQTTLGSPQSSSPSMAPPRWACCGWRPRTRWQLHMRRWVPAAGALADCGYRYCLLAATTALINCCLLGMLWCGVQVCEELAATIIENGVVRQATDAELANAKVGAPLLVSVAVRHPDSPVSFAQPCMLGCSPATACRPAPPAVQGPVRHLLDGGVLGWARGGCRPRLLPGGAGE